MQNDHPRRAMTTLAFFLGTAACLINAIGCEYAPAEAKPDPLDRTTYPRVALHEALRDAIVVSDVIEEFSDPLKVTVALRSMTHSSDRVVRYRFIYFDDAGLPQNADPDWHRRRMAARTEVFIKSNALDRDAVDWRMEIKPAK